MFTVASGGEDEDGLAREFVEHVSEVAVLVLRGHEAVLLHQGFRGRELVAHFHFNRPVQRRALQLGDLKKWWGLMVHGGKLIGWWGNVREKHSKVGSILRLKTHAQAVQTAVRNGGGCGDACARKRTLEVMVAEKR